MQYSRVVEDYAYYLKIERAMSPHTVASYCSDVQAFLNRAGKAPEEILPEDILDWLKERSAVSKRSQARFLSALKSFYHWLIMEGTAMDNPCDRIDAPKLGRYLPSVLSVQEVETILESVDTGSEKGLRNRAMLEVLYGCGLRVSELVGLKVQDLFFDEGFIRVVGKGDKQRLVPIGEPAMEAVRAYLDARSFPGQEMVFLNRNGGSLSRVSVFKIIKEQALAAGIRKDISPHTFRHSFATHLIENGADLRVVQEMLGHENIMTTEIYTHIDTSTWHKDIIAHHPRK